jgi:hypothetical protein
MAAATPDARAILMAELRGTRPVPPPAEEPVAD